MGRPGTQLVAVWAVFVFLLVPALYGSPIQLLGQDSAQGSVSMHHLPAGGLALPRQARGEDDESWVHDKTEGGAMDWYWYRRRSFDFPIAKTPGYLHNKQQSHLGK